MIPVRSFAIATVAVVFVDGVVDGLVGGLSSNVEKVRHGTVQQSRWCTRRKRFGVIGLALPAER
jgi:hypothetical protein